ncbi:hypothetical protein [Flagellimonas meishanensis]|uniref:hypothetical protein n=1 Tax=Flagellimonas meishanensis TaxID=2873264 RepID=UPI001CA6CD6B|nr:hypothetical protein [[Muricauda] meishanensis]
MKKSKFLSILSLAVMGFFLVQCTSDLEIPDPIAGPPGQDGVDGIDGIDGEDGTASCIACHSNTAREPIIASFSVSMHGVGTTFARGASPNCAQCHGNAGYIDYLAFGAVDTAGYANPMPINCTTCHDKHSTFDFENDGFDYALRNIDPVTLVIDGTTVIDFGGSSNNCITCHQPRNSYVIPAENGTGKYVITSTRFGPHHGPQATVLEGIMGANIAGSEGYPGVGSATHRTGSSCVECHMGPSSDTNEGLHSWNPTADACIACHPNGTPDEIGGFTSDFETLGQLLTQVVGEEYEEDVDGNPVFDIDGNPVGNGTPVVGIIINGRSQTGIFTTAEAQAAWNYMTALEDQSKGIHNPAYIRALLKNSIEALQD